jgi:hypothetical protein
MVIESHVLATASKPGRLAIELRRAWFGRL